MNVRVNELSVFDSVAGDQGWEGLSLSGGS